MPINIKKPPKKIGDIRRAQVITTFGPGAIVDMPDYSVIMAGTNYWNPKEEDIIHEKNLEKLLKVEGFRYPSVSYDEDKGKDLPAFRFPLWHFCPNCNRLMPYRNFGDNEVKTCPKCKENNKLVPSRFIAACVNGHLEDFPYQWWVHKGQAFECNDDMKNENLRIEFKDSTGGLESIVIHCAKCGQSRSMAGSMNKDSLRGYRCNGKRPWLGSKREFWDTTPCEAQIRGLQRGGSNVYYSETVAALTIPPHSSVLNQEINKKMDQLRQFLDMGGDINTPYFEGVIAGTFHKFMHGTYNYSLEYIKDQIMISYKQEDNADYSEHNLFEDEYNVFCTGNHDEREDMNFRISSEPVPDYLEGYIEKIVLAKRLREVLALRGFRRISPSKPSVDNPDTPGWNGKETDVVSLSDKKLGWLPAIEMLGEGIFIQLNEERLTQWENKVKNRYTELEKRVKKSFMEYENYSVRYVLLHTLSHLLIRQLAVECGYSGSSIRERIYSTYPDSNEKMCGILLYTSASDSDGSLGGLVRNGQTKQFGEIFEKMLEEATWCSSDPLCISSMAQGFESLNYAACHACALLPETSCVARNTLLDRVSVIGGIDKNGNRDGQGYFSDLFEEEDEESW